jgi:hypothetical protein
VRGRVDHVGSATCANPGSRAVAIACGLALALACAGCLNIHYTEGSPLPRERIALIKAGETTKAEVLTWFGAPEGFSDVSALERLLRDFDLEPESVLDLPFADALVFRFTEGDGRGYVIPPVYVNLDLRVVSDVLVVFFDDADRVLYYGVQEDSDELDRATE